LEIGKNIRRRRVLLGIKQQTLADTAGVKRPYLSRVERGLTIPSVVMVKRFADALDTTVGDLAGEVAYAKSATKEIRLLRETVARYDTQLQLMKKKLRSIKKTAS